jgi:ADP-heptose:LPS heptosyltransferase
MSIPFHSKVRKSLRSGMNWLMLMLAKKTLNLEKIPTDEINHILIIRINYRIGNILFLTPLINALAKKIPHAKIDVLIGAKFIAPILSPMKNINIVYDAPRALLKNPIKLINKVKEINSNHYDLVISPIAASGSANVSTLLIQGKYKLGFHSDQVWSAANITVPFPQDTTHEALIPLALMNAFDGEEFEYERSLDIRLSIDEINLGKETLLSLVKNNQYTLQNNTTFIGVFRDARNDKKIVDTWWNAFVDYLLMQDNIVIIDILPPNQIEAIHEKSLPIAFQNLRELGGFMSSLDFFICADTGPMHLASAAKTSVIALFNATSPDHYGPLGLHDRVVNIVNKSTKDVVDEVIKQTNAITQEKRKQIKVLK